MKVYLVTSGSHDTYGVLGVYATPAAAMQAHPIPSDYRRSSAPGRWIPVDHADGERCWTNGLNWDDQVRIEPYEVLGEQDNADRGALESGGSGG